MFLDGVWGWKRTYIYPFPVQLGWSFHAKRTRHVSFKKDKVKKILTEEKNVKVQHNGDTKQAVGGRRCKRIQWD